MHEAHVHPKVCFSPLLQSILPNEATEAIKPACGRKQTPRGVTLRPLTFRRRDRIHQDHAKAVLIAPGAPTSQALALQYRFRALSGEQDEGGEEN